MPYSTPADTLPVERLVEPSSLLVQDWPDDLGNSLEYRRRLDRCVLVGELADLVTADAVDDASELGIPEATGTHRTRLGAGVHDRFAARLAIEFASRTVCEMEFRMAANVSFCHDAVRGLHDDLIVADEYRAKRAVAAIGGRSGECKCSTQMRFVIEAVELWCGHVRTLVSTSKNLRSSWGNTSPDMYPWHLPDAGI